MSEWVGKPGTPWRRRPHGWWETLLVPRLTPGAHASAEHVSAGGKRMLVDWLNRDNTIGVGFFRTYASNGLRMIA